MFFSAQWQVFSLVFLFKRTWFRITTASTDIFLFKTYTLVSWPIVVDDGRYRLNKKKKILK